MKMDRRKPPRVAIYSSFLGNADVYLCPKTIRIGAPFHSQ